MRIMKFIGWLGLFGLSLTVIAACDATYAGSLAMNAETGGLVMLGFLGILIDRAQVENFFIALKTTFQNAFDAAPSTWEKIAMRIPSTTGQNDYSWLSNFPKMRRWVGEKHIKALKAYKYSIENADFETTVEAKANDIKDGNMFGYSLQAKTAGISAKQLPDEVVMDLVNGAFTEEAYDGQYFCDTDHDVGGASVSNKITAVLSSATLAAAQAGFGVAKTMMKKFKDDDGRPLNVTPTVLLVGPALEDTAKTLMTAKELEDGKPNPYVNSAEVVVDARITSDTAWFLLDTSKPVMPFIWQEREAPTFVQQTGDDSREKFMRGIFLFGAEARGEGGYGFWQLCVGSTGAG